MPSSGSSLASYQSRVHGNESWNISSRSSGTREARDLGPPGVGDLPLEGGSRLLLEEGVTKGLTRSLLPVEVDVFKGLTQSFICGGGRIERVNTVFYLWRWTY